MTKCHKVIVAAFAGTFALAIVGCAGGSEKPTEVVLVTHDSFVVSKDVKKAFEDESGLTWRILQSGDAGEALTKALLTAGNPQGDVFFGVDNNLLSRALEGELFEPYEPSALENVDAEHVLDPEYRATPIDRGDVCLNYDKAWFNGLGGGDRLLSMNDLSDPIFEDTLVVENPATSTPGLAFLLATIARYGDPGWQEYWRELRANGVLVVDGWEEAYNVRFSGSAGKGNRPVVVSYASSPPAEVIFRTPRPTQAPTAVIEDSCFRQIELAGVLRGARNEEGARKLIDFMLSKRFQEDVPLSMFVFPVNREAALPREFERYATVPQEPLELPPEEIEANRDRWVKEWTDIVIR